MSLTFPGRSRLLQNPFYELDTDMENFFVPNFTGSLDLVKPFPKAFANTDIVKRTDIMKWDMIETPSEYKISAELPGMLKENINVDIDDGILTITAEKEESKVDEGSNYVFKERSWGNVRRSLRLPKDADENSVSAMMENGCLHVNVAKTDETHSKKRIPILEKEN